MKINIFVNWEYVIYDNFKFFVKFHMNDYYLKFYAITTYFIQTIEARSKLKEFFPFFQINDGTIFITLVSPLLAGLTILASSSFIINFENFSFIYFFFLFVVVLVYIINYIRKKQI